MRSTQIVSWIFVATIALSARAVSAGAGHDGHEGMDHAGMEMHAEAAPAEGVGGAWAALRETRDTIAADIEAGKLAEIHVQSEKLAPEGQMLLDRSSELAPDKRARVEGAVKQLASIGAALDAAGDAGKAEETRAQLKRLDGLLELVRSQYPPAVLNAPRASGPDHAAMGHDMGMHGEHVGGAGAHTHATKPLAAVDAAPKSTVTVTSGEFSFAPKVVELRAGEPTRIELVNQGKVEHALVVAEPSGKGDWIHLHAAPGATDGETFEIDVPGRYKLLCTVAGHTEAGMVGELVVVAR